VADGHVFALSGEGTLICVRASDGREVWRKSMQDLGGTIPKWEYCESVLVDGNRVVCTPGGPQGAIVAFDKTNGRLLWQTKELDDLAHYSSVVPTSIHGKPQYVQLFEKRVVGISPDNGKLLWEHPFPGEVAVITTPIVHNNQVFITAGYGVGCKLIEISASNKTTEIYDNNVMKNHHGGVVLVGDHLYGFSDDIGWTCMDFKTGRRVWRDRENLGKGSLAYAEGLLYCVSEGDGAAPTDVMLIEASPAGWEERGKFKLSPQTKLRKPSGRVWTHPVVVGGKLYLRDQELLFCFDVKAR
jgi:outer membrane protein assembly factor BamB